MSAIGTSQDAIRRCALTPQAWSDPESIRLMMNGLAPDDPLCALFRGLIYELQNAPADALSAYLSARHAVEETSFLGILLELRAFEVQVYSQQTGHVPWEEMDARAETLEQRALKGGFHDLALEAMRVRGSFAIWAAEKNLDRRVWLLSRAGTYLEGAVHAVLGAIQDLPAETASVWLESFGHLFLERIRCLCLLSETHEAFASDAERAWGLFRFLRQRADVRLSRSTDRCALPASTALLEFMALPKDHIRVAVTIDGQRTHGRLSSHVHEASLLQKKLQDTLWDIQPTADMALAVPSLIARCAAAEEASLAFSQLLLDADLTWSSGETTKLGTILRDTPVSRWIVVPHGPLQSVLWSFLRQSPAQPYLIERVSLLIAPSTKQLVVPFSNEARTHGFWIAQYEPPPDCLSRVFERRSEANEEAVEVARHLLNELARARGAALIGHAAFVHKNLARSFIELEAAGAPRISALDIQRAAVDAPGRDLCSIILGLCEAGELYRRHKITDFQNIAYSFLVAGAPQALASSWSITTLGDEFLAVLYADLFHNGGFDLAATFHARLRDQAADWRESRESASIERLVVGRCWSAGDLVPFADMAAMNVYGSSLIPQSP